MALAAVLNQGAMYWFGFMGGPEERPSVTIRYKVSSSVPSAKINYTKVQANINETNRPTISVKKRI